MFWALQLFRLYSVWWEEAWKNTKHDSNECKSALRTDVREERKFIRNKNREWRIEIYIQQQQNNQQQLKRMEREKKRLILYE